MFLLFLLIILACSSVVLLYLKYRNVKSSSQELNLSIPPIGSYSWDRAKGFIEINGSNFEFQDGTPFFAIGVNYEGWYDRCWRMWESSLFDQKLIERDFAKMRWLGINTVRIFIQQPLVNDITLGDWSKLDAVVQVAKKYKVFLLITFWDYESDLNSAVNIDEKIAQRYSNETIIFGYDLKNEPQINLIVSKEGWQNYLKQKYTYIENLNKTWNSINSFYSLSKGEKNFQNIGIPGEAWNSPRWGDFLYYLNQELKLWLKAQIEAIRKYDKVHLITVGYNDVRLASLPANELLDFISIHTYYNQLNEQSQRPSLMVLDYLHVLYPNKPIVYEEFGLSNEVASYEVSAAKESTIYFYTYLKGFAGAFKWMLNDHILNPNPYEEKFGIFTLKDGKEFVKPIAYLIKAFSRYVESIRYRPTLKNLLFAKNFPYLLQLPDEYFLQLASLTLYGYDLSNNESKGELAIIYVASCYGSKEVELKLARVNNTIIFLRFLPSVNNFNPNFQESFSREEVFKVKIYFPTYSSFTINNLTIKFLDPNNVPLFLNGTSVLSDNDGRIISNKYRNFVSIPFMSVLSQLPHESVVQLLEKCNLPEADEVAGIKVNSYENLPLAMEGGISNFVAFCHKRESAFSITLYQEKASQGFILKEKENYYLYLTSNSLVNASLILPIYGEAKKTNEGWKLSSGIFIVKP